MNKLKHIHLTPQKHKNCFHNGNGSVFPSAGNGNFPFQRVCVVTDCVMSYSARVYILC